MISLKNTLNAIATKWKDISIGSNYITIGNLGICWGNATHGNNVTFPITFTSIPNIYTNAQGTMSNNYEVSITTYAYNRTTSGFKMWAGWHSNSAQGSAGEVTSWVAIGNV